MKKLSTFICLLTGLSACEKPRQVVASRQTADFKKAEAFLSGQKNDSAFYYFDKAASGSKDSLEIAMAYNYMASIQTDAGDHYGAQESLVTSLTYLNEQKKENRYCLSSDYNELGMTSSRLENYDNAISYLDSALKYGDDKNYRLIFANNKANIYRRKGSYSDALKLYRQVLKGTEKGSKDYARLLSNMVYTKWLKDPAYHAAPELKIALNIRQALKDEWGSNASYGHLSDYYRVAKPDSAVFYARAMYSVANKLKSPDDQVSALEKLIRLSSGENEKRYFDRYYKLTDSLQTARNAAKNQFALIRYHTEKHKADNLRLKQENTEKEHEIFRQRLFIAIGFVILVGLFLWFRSRRQRLLLEADNRIRQDRLQVFQKVHDVVANGIYRVMNEVDYSEEVDKNYLLGQLEFMYEQSRKISQDEDPGLQEEFSEKLQQLVNAFKRDAIKLALSGNEPELWESVNARIKDQLKLVLQELLVNMSKHSHATQAIIDFELRSSLLLISYRDNGVGFPTNIRKGKGLQNTENRIKAMGGELIFGAEEKPGAGLQISIPIN